MLLMEAVQLRQMIVEAREDGILKRFIPILVKDWDKLRPKMVNVSSEVINILQGIYSNEEIKVAQDARSASYNEPANPELWTTMLAEGTIRYILANDPDPKKTFSTWIVTMFSRGYFLLEDLPRVTDGIAIYLEAKRAHHIPRNHDLGTVKTLGDFYDLIAPFRGDSATGEIVDRTYEAQMYQQAEVLLDSPNYKVLKPLTKEAAQWFGRHTEWCTAWGSKFGRNPTRSCHYGSYSNAPLYITQRKSDGALWQFSFEHGQYMDVDDRQIMLSRWLHENREAAIAIGMENFVKLIGHYNIKLDGFQPQDLVGVDPKLLALHVEDRKGFEVIPAETRDTPEFWFALISTRWAPWSSDRADRLQAAIPILKHYVKILNQGVILQGVEDVPEFFPHLPKKFHTEEIKETMMNRISPSIAAECIPQPWNEDTTRNYYERGVFQNAFYVSTIKKAGEKFITPEMIVHSAARNPHELGDPKIEARVTEKMMVQIIEKTGRHSVLGEHLTDRFQTRAVANAFYEIAKLSPHDDDLHRGMACLNYDLWPWKSGKLCMKIASHLTCHYDELPEQVKDAPNFITMWLDENSTNFQNLPIGLATEETFLYAIRAEGSRKGYYKLNPHAMTHVLAHAEPTHVKPEWIDALNAKFPGLIEDVFRKIPAKFRSPSLVQALGKKGFVGFDDPSFVGENITPQIVTANVQKNYFKGYRQGYAQQTYHGTTEKRKAADAAYIVTMKEFWKDKLPDVAKTHDILVAFIDERMDDVLLGMPKEALTSELLSAWVKRREAYDDSSYGSDRMGKCPLSKSIIFARFPKTSYTPENMQRAVEIGLINKVPDDLISDDVIVELLGSREKSKNIPWDRMTPALLFKGAKKHGMGIIDLEFPKDFLKQEEMAFALIDGALKGERNYFDIYKSSFQGVFGDPATRVNWSQRLYNLALSIDLLDIGDVPAEFRNDDADLDAIKKKPSNILTIENQTEWLTRHMPTADFYAILKYGLINTPEGWRHLEADVECEDGFYTVAKNRAGKRCVAFFDKHRNLVNVAYWQLPIKKDNHWDDKSFADREGDRAKHTAYGLWPVRRTVAKAFNDLQLGDAIGYDTLKKLGAWTNDDRSWVTLTEDLEREKFGELTFVIRSDTYREQIAYCYRGTSREMIARIKVEQHGSDHRFEACAIAGDVGQYVDLAANFADLMGKLDCPAGSGKAFKESPLYVSLGVRGPGRYVWGSYFGEKVMTAGKLSVWKGMDRVAVAHSKYGLLAVGKVTKDGSFTSTEDFTPAGREVPYSLLSGVFDAMKGKV